MSSPMRWTTSRDGFLVVDQKNLARLRAKYAGATAEVIDDPTLRAVAETLFSAGGRRVQPYAGIPTFLDQPYVES